MSDQLTKQIANMEKQFEDLKTYFASAGNLTPEELQVLKSVKTKLESLKQTAKRAPSPAGSGSAQSAASASTARSPAKAGAASSSAPPAKGGASGKGDVQFGGAVIEKMSLGPPVVGPRIKELYALLAADGSGAMNRSNAKFGAQLNESGVAVLKTFMHLKDTQLQWLNLYDEVGKLSTRSAEGVKKMEQSAPAIGKRSKERGGAYVRGQSEAYLKAQRNVEDKVRAIGALEEAVRKSLSELNEAGLGKAKKAQERDVEGAKDAVETEKKRVEELKSRLNGLLDVAIKVVKQDWASLAEDAVKFVGGQMIDAIPTTRLDELKQQLEQASAKLRSLEDLSLLAAIETASAGLRGAAKALDDGRHDVVDALADLNLAQKTAIEALGESRTTADAAKMIALRAQMLALMQKARQAVERYQRESPPVVAELERVAGLYRSLPGVLKMSPNIDLTSDYGKSLAATAQENADALAVWKSYVVDIQNSCVAALGRLADAGEGGFLAHFNRVPELLQTAIVNR